MWNEQGARGRTGKALQAPSWSLRCATWCYKIFWKNIFFPDDACIWYFFARKKAFQLLDNQHFDAVVTVSLPFTGQLLGLALKRRWPRLRWLSDIGDPFAFTAFPLNNQHLYGRWNRRLEKSALTIADVAVVTTPHTATQYEKHYGQTVREKIKVIPPLLHPLPAVSSKRPFRADGKCRIGYFGALYAPVRTPDVLLRLIYNTLQTRPQWTDLLEVHFYGDIFPEFYDALRACPVVRLHGLQERNVAQTAMRDMDFLLNIGNQTEFQLPGKAVEYWAAAKPIINISYTHPDPFADFLNDHPAVFHLRVQNGHITENDFDLWLGLLERGAPVLPDAGCLQEAVQPFSLPFIAADYLQYLRDPST